MDIVYSDLITARGWVDVQVKETSSADRSYISGKPTETSISEVVIPVLSNESNTHQSLHAMIDEVTTHAQVAEANNKSVNLAVCGLDSTLVYYKLTSGIAPLPGTDGAARPKKQRLNHRRNHPCGGAAAGTGLAPDPGNEMLLRREDVTQESSVARSSVPDRACGEARLVQDVNWNTDISRSRPLSRTEETSSPSSSDHPPPFRTSVSLNHRAISMSAEDIDNDEFADEL